MTFGNKIVKSYFFNSFFWSTLSKVLNAIFGFISVPLLLGYFGKAEIQHQHLVLYWPRGELRFWSLQPPSHPYCLL